MLKFLIVDDEFTARMLLLTLLRPHGECDIAVDGEEALKAVRQAIHAGHPYDLICLDIMMPGMDGQTCLSQIRRIEEEEASPRPARIIMATALDDPGNIAAARTEKCDAYLVKPVDRIRIEEQLAKLHLIQPPAAQSKLRVLVADDDPATLLALSGVLGQNGYNVTQATDGNQARDILLAENPPELAILDWVMPGINGTDICQLIRRRPSGPFIYIILLTGKSSRSERLEGLRSGAHDMLHKPFDSQELLARLEIGQRILDYERRLADDRLKLGQYAAQMETLADSRARQLIHADRLASLGTMAAGIAHEINNPMATISGNIQLLGTFWPLLHAALRGEPPASDKERRQRAFIEQEVPELIAAIESGVKRVSSIVRNLGKFARQGFAKKEPAQLDTCIDQALEVMGGLIRQAGIKLSVVKENTSPALVSTLEIVQVLINLIHNACQAMRDQSSEKKLTLALHQAGDMAVLDVTDSGPGIPPRLLDSIWKPFFTTKPAGEGTGLGLSICHSIVSDHNGRISASNLPEGGARFRLEIPVLQKPKPHDTMPGL